MVKVAFTGSFDPPHEGHKYVVEQARKLGFEVLVVVANNVNKVYQKSIEERAFNTRLFMDRRVRVVSCDSENIGTTIKEHECSAIIRGLRNEEDYKYEQEISDYNLSVNGLPTIYIQSPIELREVSSSAIKKANG